jgi:adenylate cyclase
MVSRVENGGPRARSRPLRWLLPGLVLVGLVVLQGIAPNWANGVEGWTIDKRFQLRGSQEPRFPIVIVALDEDSVQSRNELSGENVRTWPRQNWATLVRAIALGNPTVIGLDVVFDTVGWDAGGDEELAEALAEAGNVVIPSHFEMRGELHGSAQTLSEPLPDLGNAAAAVALIDLPADSDQVLRRVSPLLPWEDRIHPAFSTAVATLYTGQPVSLQSSDLGTDGSLFINFRGHERTFDTYSMYRFMPDELLDPIDPAIFEDSIVLVGFTTELEQDIHPAPFAEGRGMPGVEIQANAIDTLLAGDWLIRPPAWLPVVLVGLMGGLGLAALNLRKLSIGLIAVLVAVVLYGVLGFALFKYFRYLLPIVAPVAAIIAVGSAALGERVVFVELDKRRIRQRFAGVMSPERLNAVLENWESLVEVDRPQKEATVLFADIRGFTSTTEALMHQERIPEMVSFLTAYLDMMAEAVFAEGGVIYDVVGDGLMILFGVPDPYPDHGLRGVRAAVRMALATQDLQATWPLRDEGQMRMGIGVHCGSVVDAMVGRGRRVEYAVIGDPVNTAARIESHCKVAMDVPRPPRGEVPENVTILISADLWDLVQDDVLIDDTVPVCEARGKSEPLEVVRLLGLRDKLG